MTYSLVNGEWIYYDDVGGGVCHKTNRTSFLSSYLSIYEIEDASNLDGVYVYNDHIPVIQPTGEAIEVPGVISQFF